MGSLNDELTDIRHENQQNKAELDELKGALRNLGIKVSSSLNALYLWHLI